AVLDLRVGAFRAGRARGLWQVGGGVVAAPRAHGHPRPLHAHLELAEAPVARNGAGAVAEQVVAARLGRDAQDARLELVALGHREAAGVARQALRAAGLLADVGDRRQHVLLVDALAELDAVEGRELRQPARVDE